MMCLILYVPFTSTTSAREQYAVRIDIARNHQVDMLHKDCLLPAACGMG